ncbi:copper resistance protein NlpE [Gallibacterium genomosp. 3]|uniref:copper resistance protein NlpE n=1 Tax=Gallibacterium genomosp. 3 TaxID=505345 RepID=UPI0008028464|nr:copper resistance protein NlpE [Gallibacterium genomosp. 3]
MKKYTLNAVVALASIAIFGCQTVTTPQANPVAGKYLGTLPCADCDGIKTTLFLNPDKSFNLKSEYLGKPDAVFTENGIYTIENQLITLKASADGEKHYYKITDQGLAVSDQQGHINTDENSKDYLLKKQ